MGKKTKKKKLGIIAHRCRGYGAPENTLLALKRALASPIDEIEIDLQLTKDNKYVMIHNPWFVSKESATAYVYEHTLKDLREEREVEATSLDQVLAAFKQYGKGKRINLDIKRYGQEKELIATIKKHGLERDVIIVSWMPNVLKRINELDKKILLSFTFVPMFFFLSRIQKELGIKNKNKYHLYLNKIEAHTESPEMHGHLLTNIPKLPIMRVNILSPYTVHRRIVKQAERRGLEVAVVNCDNHICAWRLKRLGVTHLMTNKPRKFIY